MDDDPLRPVDQLELNKASMIQGTRCNSNWLNGSLIVDTRGSMSVVSFSGLAKATQDNISDIL